MKFQGQIPKIVICAGLPRSGSTWIYNATLSLLRSQKKAVGIFSNIIPSDLCTFAEDDTCLVIKCHAPDDNLIALARIADAPIIITVRDPRDSLVSFEAAFASDREGALYQLTESASAILKLRQIPNALVFQYESNHDRVHIIEALAALLNVPANPNLISAVAEEFSPEIVRNKIEQWQAAGTLDPTRPAEVWTEESHWHANHCGDGLVGKYLDQLSARDSVAVGNRLRDFFAAFAYAPTAAPALKSGETIEFAGDGIAYAVEGFANAEPWGAWTVEPTARIVLPLDKAARRVELEMTLMRSPCFNSDNIAPTAKLLINNRRVTDLFRIRDLPSETVFLYNGSTNRDRVDIEFRFEGLASPQSLGLADDARMLGVGVRTIRITYQ